LSSTAGNLTDLLNDAFGASVAEKTAGALVESGPAIEIARFSVASETFFTVAD
jgi:hypothetical protein